MPFNLTHRSAINREYRPLVNDDALLLPGPQAKDGPAVTSPALAGEEGKAIYQERGSAPLACVDLHAGDLPGELRGPAAGKVDLDAATGDRVFLRDFPNPALSIAGPGQTGLSENPLATVDTKLSAASHKALRNRGKP